MKPSQKKQREVKNENPLTVVCSVGSADYKPVRNGMIVIVCSVHIPKRNEYGSGAYTMRIRELSNGTYKSVTSVVQGSFHFRH